jgi:hypothetical protein
VDEPDLGAGPLHERPLAEPAAAPVEERVGERLAHVGAGVPVRIDRAEPFGQVGGERLGVAEQGVELLDGLLGRRFGEGEPRRACALRHDGQRQTAHGHTVRSSSGRAPAPRPSFARNALTTAS